MKRTILLIGGIVLLATSTTSKGNDAIADCIASCIRAAERQHGNIPNHARKCARFCQEALGKASDKTLSRWCNVADGDHTLDRPQFFLLHRNHRGLS